MHYTKPPVEHCSTGGWFLLAKREEALDCRSIEWSAIFAALERFGILDCVPADGAVACNELCAEPVCVVPQTRIEALCKPYAPFRSIKRNIREVPPIPGQPFIKL